MGIVWFSHVTGAIPVQLITAPDLSAVEAHPGILETVGLFSPQELILLLTSHMHVRDNRWRNLTNIIYIHSVSINIQYIN